MGSPQDEDARPLASKDELVEFFHAAEKPRERHRIGAEAEKIAVFAAGQAPLLYAGERGIEHIFAELQRFGWQAESETSGGPVIALRRGAASVTLEPGSQLELSGAALPDVHQVHAEFDQHFAELRGVTEELGLVWLGIGFHPLARQADLDWVPKQRYGIMREYLPPLGAGAHDMMRRTATVQANFDYASEADALHKLVTSLKLSPLLHAMTANAPFIEGRVSEFKSVRGDVWLRMDPARSGLIEPLWRKARPGYADYVEWALEAGMFLFKRGNDVVANTGQTFRSFFQDGYRGERATRKDWQMHLNTLFPEVRLKNTLELRAVDSQSRPLSSAVVALMTGLLYDARALDQASELVQGFEYDAVQEARPRLVREGIAGSFLGQPTRVLAARVLEIARGGLERRGLGETSYLAPLEALVARGRTPADELLSGLRTGEVVPGAEIVRRTRMAL